MMHNIQQPADSKIAQMVDSRLLLYLENISFGDFFCSCHRTSKVGRGSICCLLELPLGQLWLRENLYPILMVPT